MSQFKLKQPDRANPQDIEIEALQLYIEWKQGKQHFEVPSSKDHQKRDKK